MQSAELHSASPLFTSKDVSNRLKVGRSTVWKLVREGKLVPVKIGSATRFRPEDVDRLIEEGRAGV